jgi:hypothetical protein
MEIEKNLMEENEDLIDKIGLLKLKSSLSRLLLERIQRYVDLAI